ncbi:glycerophosphodiester phosphodiesterase [Acaryochloris sp. CCMEE 5410]|uniref:glycerophosphodiester phosphodiesterase n=1 Tax=Acaryochloris sp. CCMEE 5410 TaxID=310037 RepID=UPI00024852F0|nr:glycerophosphodiester phosphodiesterase [Acaryochloris sp. CCMEE 5410]KAI9131127.1 glycerophosphodiester phosphodiesterase [Acaryochloris sp. CCMEE 5410]
MVPQITAHRGYSQLAPENTIPAFELAIEHQADFIELDVQETKDHGLVVIHDSHLLRLAGCDRNLWNLTTSELANLDVGQWFGEAFKHTRIPSLASVMDLAKDRVNLNLELKIHGHEQKLVSQVVELIHEKNWQQNCVVSSLDFDILRQVRTLDPGLTIGPVIPPARPEYPDFEVDFYSLHFTLATPERVKRAHAEGKAIHAWTVNQPDDMQRMIEHGVDNIITDQSAVFQDLNALK